MQQQTLPAGFETVYHVTVLSNFARAFDKYSRTYDKSAIAESTFPGQFFVLKANELEIGRTKASRLLEKLNLPGNRLLVLAAQLATKDMLPNLRTGKGRYLPSDRLPVNDLYVFDTKGNLEPMLAEEAYAQSLRLLNPTLLPYDALLPRTLSILPIARACQASCRFCFSESSASVEQMPHGIDVGKIEALCQRAKAAGAERFVITGGGEPGLVKHAELLELIRLGHQYLGKVVLITNGIHLAKLTEEERFSRLNDYYEAGLSVLSVSRHHNNRTINQDIMGVDTRTERVIATWAQNRDIWPQLRMRLICVLQTGGIEDEASLAAYVDWATGQGVEELCFKELYVSTTLESAYHANPENQWSLEHQVSLSLITGFFQTQGFEVVATLPWGSPVFGGRWQGRPLNVAAYTEPSLFWERSQGIARSWNIMADGSCLVSLEDPHSELPGTEPEARPMVRLKVA